MKPRIEIINRRRTIHRTNGKRSRKDDQRENIFFILYGIGQRTPVCDLPYAFHSRFVRRFKSQRIVADSCRFLRIAFFLRLDSAQKR